MEDLLYELMHPSNLMNQFRTLPGDLTNQDYDLALRYLDKNKFPNVLAPESTMVKVGGVPYINASYILDNYIATCEPILQTISDFWNMVFQTQAGVIINLEGNNFYFTLSPFVSYLSIEIEQTQFFSSFEIRKIRISHIPTQKDHIVYHLTINKWLDFNVPDPDLFMKLRDLHNLYRTSKRTVVHCRGGIGRTGTFILIDYVFRILRNNECPNIINILHMMRKARANMIQNDRQFMFVILMTKRYIENKMRDPEFDKMRKSA